MADRRHRPPRFANVPPELVNHPKFLAFVRELQGRGGMGVIYLAEHRVMEKLVRRLKVISPAVLDNPDVALARFHAEVKAAGKLDHQNIARALRRRSGRATLHFLSSWSTSRASSLGAVGGEKGTRCRWPMLATTSARRRWACNTPRTRAWCIGISSRRT